MLNTKSILYVSGLITALLLTACSEDDKKRSRPEINTAIQSFTESKSIRLGLEDTGRGGNVSMVVSAKFLTNKGNVRDGEVTFEGGVQQITDLEIIDRNGFYYEGVLTAKDDLAKSYEVKVGCSKEDCAQIIILGPVAKAAVQQQAATAQRASDEIVLASIFDRNDTGFVRSHNYRDVASKGVRDLTSALVHFSTLPASQQ